MFADTRETETVFGPVIQAGLEALKVSKCVVMANCFCYSEVRVHTLLRKIGCFLSLLAVDRLGTCRE